MKTKQQTILEAVRESLTRAGCYDRDDMVAPVAVLWTDADGQWGPLAAQLRLSMPEFLTFGDYHPEKRIGPAIWLRCAIEGVLPEVELPKNKVPIIYLPQVSRQTLRAAEDCPPELQPLVELQYRGTVWTQKNGKDWTVEAFLVSRDGGLDLDVAKDKETRRAMLGALEQLSMTPVERLKGKRLESEDFNNLVVRDTPRDLLLWLCDPPAVRREWGEDKWKAFCGLCKSEYKFVPDKEGDLVGGENLISDGSPWRQVWERFTEAPEMYPGIRSLLKRVKPPDSFVFEEEYWPDENEKQEDELRKSLLALASLSSAKAREKIKELEEGHGKRRAWVWARMGECCLAQALEFLLALAEQTGKSIGGDSFEKMAQLYIEKGYLADDAMLRTLACVKSTRDREAVVAAIRSMYESWLEETTIHFQKLLAGNPFPISSEVSAEAGECLLFVDGLRFDVAQRLVGMAKGQGLKVTNAWRWAALPTVTATAKPAVSPIAKNLEGKDLGENYMPHLAKGESLLTPDRFHKLLADSGYQVLGAGESGDPSPENARGWSEYGKFDDLGHKLQSGLAAHIEGELQLVVERLQGLLDAGWKKVRVVTDHGWLLMPGGLPAEELPKYLVKSRWSRCAVIEKTSKIKTPTASWRWNHAEQFAVAPGIHSFFKGNEYAHGGASLQECLLPYLEFTTGEAGGAFVKIKKVEWLGLRCRAYAVVEGEQITADLRTKPGDPTSTVTSPKKVSTDGKVSLVVPDDSLIGIVVSLVFVNLSGQVIAKQTTTIGGEE